MRERGAHGMPGFEKDLAGEMHFQGPAGLWELDKGREAREHLFIYPTNVDQVPAVRLGLFLPLGMR